MDRTIVYTSAIPRSQDFLQFQKDVLYAIGYAMQASLGTSTVYDGLSVMPVSPTPNLNVIVGAGSIYEIENVDSAAYAVLGTDTNTILKQGLLINPVTLAISPPSIIGYSQNYLIEATYADQDGGSTVLPYYNSSQPSVPFSGPANSGTAQYTIRQGLCTITLKAGVAAPTGTQVTPSPDAGYVGVAVVTMANGQTQITSGNISAYPGTPLISLKLPQVPAAIQAQAANYLSDAGTANALSVTAPSYTTLAAGLTLRIKKGSTTNTASVTLSVNTSTPATVLWSDGSALIAGDWPANAILQVTYSGSVWELGSVAGPTMFARSSGSSPTVTDQSLVHYGVDTGSANSVSVSSVSPAIVSSTTAGTLFEITKVSSANTGGMAASVGGKSGNVLWPDGSAMAAGDWPASAPGQLMWDGTYFRYMSMPGPSVFARVGTGGLVHGGAASGTNTLTSTLSPAVTTLSDYTLIELTPSNANTGAVTLNPNGVGAANVTYIDGTALLAGELQPGQPALMMALSGALLLIDRSGGVRVPNIQILTSSGTYTPTAGAKKALVILTGGGAGGLGFTGANLLGGVGGGAGATAIGIFPASSQSVTIGSGGAAGQNLQSAANGGSSVFSTMTAGGGFAAAVVAPALWNGGLGGSATGGAININGVDYTGSGGGASFWGGGGTGAGSETQLNNPYTAGGTPGRAYGSGGGASYAATSGSAGAPGVCAILEF
jgi:hypothetical protein